MRTEVINGIRIYIENTETAEFAAARDAVFSLREEEAGEPGGGDGLQSGSCEELLRTASLHSEEEGPESGACADAQSSEAPLCISTARWQAARKMKNGAARELSLAATFALREALRVYGIDEAEQEYCYNEHGKPFLAQHPELFFSLSHAGNLAVAAAGYSALGVDIERIGRANERIATRFFSEGEQRLLEAATDYSLEFIKIWTAHEAFGKALGTGLSLPRGSYEAVRTGDKLLIRYSPAGQPPREYEIFQSECCEGYIISICIMAKND